MLKLSLICPCFQINNFTLSHICTGGLVDKWLHWNSCSTEIKCIYFKYIELKSKEEHGDVQAQVNKIKVALVSLPHTGNSSSFPHLSVHSIES
jgi:hypothetical protein